jgi:predicted RNA methylase
MMGTIAENTIKTALLSKSFDNVTAIVVGFGNLEQAFNNAKTFNQKSSVKTEVNTLSYDNNLKRAMPKNVPIYNLNTLMKGSQRSGAIRVLPEVKSLTKVETSNFEVKEDQNEIKENSVTELSPKGYLPNIGTAKHGHAFQSHRK